MNNTINKAIVISLYQEIMGTIIFVCLQGQDARIGSQISCSQTSLYLADKEHS